MTPRLGLLSLTLFFFFLTGCQNEILDIDRLTLSHIRVDGVNVYFDSNKDFFSYEVDKSKASVRLEVDVVNSGDTVSFYMTKEPSGDTVVNGSKQLFDRPIMTYVVHMRNRLGKHRDFTIYLAQGKLPMLWIKDPLVVERSEDVGEIDTTTSVLLDPGDFKDFAFKDNGGGNYINNGVRIVDVPEIDSQKVNGYAYLVQNSLSPMKLELEYVHPQELSLHVSGKVKDNGPTNMKALINLYFEESVFDTGGDVSRIVSILSGNPYPIQVSFGRCFLSYQDPNDSSNHTDFEVSSSSSLSTPFLSAGRSTTTIRATLSGGCQFVNKSTFENDREFGVLNLPYDLRMKVIRISETEINMTLEGRDILENDRLTPIIFILYDRAFLDGVSREDVAGSKRTMYVKRQS